MKTINLIDVVKSNVKWSISRFPDGEIQITLEDFSRKDEYDVKCRITNTEELFILMQVCDILKRHDVRFYITIYYLMGMRMDRVMDFNRPFTLKIITNILNNLGASTIDIFECHSERTLDLIEKGYEMYNEKWAAFLGDFYNCQTVFPDEGAVKRYFPDGNVSKDIVIGSKVRDINSGKITSIKVKNPEVINPNKRLLVIDDLCDGGGTFVGIAKAIKEINPDAVIDIAIPHMVNPKGIENLSKNFNHVYFSNSYKDWENLPENVTQIDII